MIEAQLHDHYAAVKRRIAWPEKRPVVIRATEERITAPIKATGEKIPFERHDYDDARILDLLETRHGYAEIGDELGIPHGTMRNYIKRRGWLSKGGRMGRRSKLLPHKDRIKALWNAGMTGVDIARELGFAASTMQTFIREQGWKR